MNDQSISSDPDPESAKLIGIVYGIYPLLGIPANLIVLILTITTESIRTVPLNICIFSLALADTMVLVSFFSSTLWVLTYDEMVCKVMGVGVYVFVVMSMILPASLAICRHAAICNSSDLHPCLSALKTRRGIFVLNAIFWTYGLTFPLPFILTDNFGLDAMGFCGVIEFDDVFLWVYYIVFVLGVIIGGYAITFTFYRKLGRWMMQTSSMIGISQETRETLAITGNVMRMIKWLLFVPVVFYHPALTCQALLRIFPNIVSVRTARLFSLTVPVPHVLDPLVTIFFVKRYRLALFGLIRRKSANSNTVHPSFNVRSVPIVE